MTNLDRYKADLEKLIKLGEEMDADLSIRAIEEEKGLRKKLEEFKKHVKGSFEKNYQRWYTEFYAVVRQIIPERLQEMHALYLGDGKRKELNVHTFTIKTG